MEIHDNSSLHTFRTEIPNVLFELGLKANELSVYLAIKRAAGDNGKCFKSLSKLADSAGVHEKTLREIKQKLSQHFDVINKPLICVQERFNEKGERETDIITIIDIWPDNFKYFLGVVPKSIPPGTKKYTTVVPKSAGEEEHIEEEPLKKTTTACGAAAVFSCLKDITISEKHKVELCKKHSEEEIIQAIGVVTHTTFKLNETLIQALRWALKEKPEIPKTPKDIAGENGTYAFEMITKNKKIASIQVEVLSKGVEIVFVGSQKEPDFISFIDKKFKERLGKYFK